MAKRPSHDYFGNERPQRYTVNGIAIVPIVGTLIKNASGFDKWYYGCTSHEDVHEDLDWATSPMASPGGARGILLRTNCAGGHHTGCYELAHRIASIATGLPVFEYCEDVRASATEYITAGCTARFVSYAALTGSIGSMMEVPIWKKYYEQLGIDVKLFVSGKYKGIGDETQEMSVEHEEFLQDWIDEAAEEFKDFMRIHRNIAEEDMEGQPFRGNVSVEKNFSDAVVANVQEVLSYF
jgi:protease-4